jgi:histidine ammonia-lyase
VSTVDAIELTGPGLEPADVVAVAREGAPITLGASAREAMRTSAAIVERLADSDEPPTGSRPGSARWRRPRFPRRGERSFSER